VVTSAAMGTETRFVEVTYRGLRVAAKAKLVTEDAASGFVEVEAPLPVGSRLTVVDGEQSFPARVVGVVEQESGAKSPPGMRLILGAAAQEPRPVAPAEPEPESGPAAAPAAETSSAPTDDAQPEGRRRRRTKKTQVGRS
jgi:hypothetical protein